MELVWLIYLVVLVIIFVNWFNCVNLLSNWIIFLENKCVYFRMNIIGIIILFLVILLGIFYGIEDIVIGSIGVVLKKVGIVNICISD